MADNYEARPPVCTVDHCCHHLTHAMELRNAADRERDLLLEGLIRRFDAHIDREEATMDRLDARIDALEKTITKWGAWLAAAGFCGMLAWNGAEVALKLLGKGG